MFSLGRFLISLNLLISSQCYWITAWNHAFIVSWVVHESVLIGKWEKNCDILPVSAFLGCGFFPVISVSSSRTTILYSGHILPRINFSEVTQTITNLCWNAWDEKWQWKLMNTFLSGLLCTCVLLTFNRYVCVVSPWHMVCAVNSSVWSYITKKRNWGLFH